MWAFPISGHKLESMVKLWNTLEGCITSDPPGSSGNSPAPTVPIPYTEAGMWCWSPQTCGWGTRRWAAWRGPCSSTPAWSCTRSIVRLQFLLGGSLTLDIVCELGWPSCIPVPPTRVHYIGVLHMIPPKMWWNFTCSIVSRLFIPGEKQLFTNSSWKGDRSYLDRELGHK